MKPITQQPEVIAAARQRRARVVDTVRAAAERGITMQGIATETRMPKNTVARITQELRGKGVIQSVTLERGVMKLYMPEHLPADPDAPEPERKFVGQVVAKRTFHPFGQTATYSASGLQPVRVGAEDHLAVPSRRGEQRVSHRPMMCMGSSISGGM